jgi:integrase
MGKLTAASVRGLIAPGRYADGQGLFLEVRGGSRVWVYRYQLGRRERLMSLGTAAAISLAEARQRHAEARSLVLRQIDPLDTRQASRAAQEPATAVSFADAAAAYIGAHQAGWHGPRSVEQWQNSLAAYALPRFGAKPVDSITVDDVLRTLSPIWTTKTVTATIVRSRLELILDYARARGWRAGENPAIWRGNLRSLLPPPGKVHRTVHRAALPWREAPALMAALASESNMAARCLRFLMLTATRSQEARACRWSEIDMATALWTIPAARMKAGKQHRVPMSDAAMDTLEALAGMRTGELVFFSRVRGRPVADTTLASLLDTLGHDTITIHGMRSCFRDWAADTGQSSDAAELALAHAVGSQVTRAYARSDLLEQRRTLMSEWGNFLTMPAARVVPIRAA